MIIDIILVGRNSDFNNFSIWGKGRRSQNVLVVGIDEVCIEVNYICVG